MMRVAGYWACVLLAVVSADPETLYKKLGDEVVLKPDAASVTGPIKSITWSDGPNIAMEWDGQTGLDSNRHFKERGSLNISNGEMTIRGLTRGDSGPYTVEINSRAAGSTRLTVISPVPTPTAVKSCDGETSCVLSCDGNTTGAEPFTYTWRLGAVELTNSSKERRIAKEDHPSAEEFSCVLQNPVSEERSQPIPNPFIAPTEPPPAAAGGLKVNTGLTVFISLLAAVLVLVFFHRWKAGMWFFQEESMPWEAGFWSRQDRPPRDAAESNGTAARREKEETDEETPMA